MIYFHVTTRASAGSILRGGFDDRSSEVIDGRLWKGVWLCDELIWQMQPDDPVAIEIELRSDAVSEYECTQDQGYRRWLVPAHIVNTGLRRLIEQ